MDTIIIIIVRLFPILIFISGISTSAYLMATLNQYKLNKSEKEKAKITNIGIVVSLAIIVFFSIAALQILKVTS